MQISYYAFYFYYYIDLVVMILVNGVVLYVMRKKNIFWKALISAFVLFFSMCVLGRFLP